MKKLYAVLASVVVLFICSSCCQTEITSAQTERVLRLKTICYLCKKDNQKIWEEETKTENLVIGILPRDKVMEYRNTVIDTLVSIDTGNKIIEMVPELSPIASQHL